MSEVLDDPRFEALDANPDSWVPRAEGFIADLTNAEFEDLIAEDDEAQRLYADSAESLSEMPSKLTQRAIQIAIEKGLAS